MRYMGEPLANISSARQFAEIEKLNQVSECVVRAENERKRKVGEATIELNEQTKTQNEILKKQLAEMEKVNTQLVKQAEDSAKSARHSHWIAIASLVVSVLSLAYSVCK